MENKKTGPALSAREITIIAIFAALTAVLAQIAIPLPFTPMPISFGLVAVYITAILLKPKHAVYAQICYLLLGAVGVPVFGNFRGGIGALFGPTGGYLMVYPIIAWIVSVALNSRKSRRAELTQSKAFVLLKSGISICIAHIILYLGGTAWLCATTGNTFPAAISLAVIPFIPLDIVKILFCIFAIVPFRSRLISMNLLMLDARPVQTEVDENSQKAFRIEEKNMKKNTLAKVAIISIILSPVLGGMIGKFIAVCDLFQFHHVYFDDGLVYLGTIVWLVASILFYFNYNTKAVGSGTDIDNQSKR